MSSWMNVRFHIFFNRDIPSKESNNKEREINGQLKSLVIFKSAIRVPSFLSNTRT